MTSDMVKIKVHAALHTPKSDVARKPPKIATDAAEQVDVLVMFRNNICMHQIGHNFRDVITKYPRGNHGFEIRS
jgi:hypothetical protein